MKYIAVIDTDDFEDFGFFEDGNGKYLHAIDEGSVDGEWICLYFKEAPELMKNDMVGVDGFYGGYNQALKDCGVVKDD